MAENIDFHVKTDQETSVLYGRNGPAKLSAFYIWKGGSGMIHLDGISSRHRAINGGFEIKAEEMDELARKWLEARAPRENPKSTPSNCVLPSCKFNTIPPGENSQECVSCEGNGKKIYIHVSGGVVDDVYGPPDFHAIVIDEDNGDVDDDTANENKEFLAEIEDMVSAGVVVPLNQN